MDNIPEPLFRQEALVRRVDQLSGNAAIAIPVQWQVIVYLIVGIVVIALIFLSEASYSRVEVVTGTIVPDSGVSSIFPTKAGVITALEIREGQHVEAYARLASVRSEQDDASGFTTGQKIENAIARQDASLGAQMNAIASSNTAQQAQLAGQREGLKAEIDQVQTQITLQRELVASAQKDLDIAQKIADRGFISGRDLQTREEKLLSRQQALAQLTQGLLSRQTELNGVASAVRLLTAQSQIQSANIASSRAEVEQGAATASAARSYVLRAPVGGRVTAITARVGQAADPRTPIMAIIPKDSVLQAELAVPPSSIGFLERGQKVKLAIDAFPYQRYGTVEGTVLAVAESAISRQEVNGSVFMAYPITVGLKSSRLSAFGKHQNLVSGMTLTARIVTERRPLIKWLFEPLFVIGIR